MKKERFVLVERGRQVDVDGEIFQECYPLEDGRVFIAACDLAPQKNSPVFYCPVSFPESQLFMDEHQHEVYLINDQQGIEKYGNAAYFVEESLYQKVRAAFEKEMAIPTLPVGRQK